MGIMGITDGRRLYMNHEEIIAHIAEIEREIAVLPAGGVSKKNVHGKTYFYHRITQNGKRTEKYVKAEDVDELKLNIEKRKKLEKELKKLKQCMPKEKNLDLQIDKPVIFSPRQFFFLI